MGYLTNREEEHRLTRPNYQRDLALGIAEGLYGFFAQYPPGESAPAHASREDSGGRP